MCGIIGYTGYSQARDVLLKGLKSLEYRGYDSAVPFLMIRTTRSPSQRQRAESKICNQSVTALSETAV